MKAILNQKAEKNQARTTVIELDNLCDGELHGLVSKKGIILLLAQSSAETFIPLLEEYHFEALNPPSKKIELFRSLKFANHSFSELPRRIHLQYGSIGAFKRSFLPFFNNRYTLNSPACVLFIPDSIHLGLVEETAKKRSKKDNTEKLSEFDPYLRSWLCEVSKEPIVLGLNDAYLGESNSAMLTRALIFKASQVDSPVMLLGESGTGKTLIAKLIHENSSRKKGAFVVINCSAIPETLFESEMFGHTKWAFSDARVEKPGIFEIADKGTLFLDEVGDLSLVNQAKLLLACESKEYRRVGSITTKKSDVRIIAATNSNIQMRVQLKSFRKDLFFRLNNFQIVVPPLRERHEDIRIIANAIWSRIDKQFPLSDEFLAYLKKETWPGNVRELQMVLENINAIFGNRPPSREGVECLHKLRNDFDKSPQLELENNLNKLRDHYKDRLAQSIHIIRGIRVKFRPLINNDPSVIRNPQELKKIRSFVDLQNAKLDELCRDPLYFKDPALYDRIRCFRYDLDLALKNLPQNPENFHELWYRDFQDAYDEIFKKIFKLVWSQN